MSQPGGAERLEPKLRPRNATVMQKCIPCLSTQRQKGPDWSPPNRSRHHRLEGSCRAGQQGSGKGRGRRSRLLWASPWGRHHVRWGHVPHGPRRRGQRSPAATAGSARPRSGGSGQRQPKPSHRRSRPHLGKGRCPEGPPADSALPSGAATPKPTRLCSGPVHTQGCPCWGGSPGGCWKQNRDERPDKSGHSAERDRHVCPSRRGQARLLTRLPGAPPCAGHWGPSLLEMLET